MSLLPMFLKLRHLDEYKADIKKKIKERKKEEGRAKKENQAVDRKLSRTRQMDIPDAMIEYTGPDRWQMILLRDYSQQGLTMEQYFQFTGMTQRKMTEEMKPQAVRRESRQGWFLKQSQKLRILKLSEEDLKKNWQKMAESYQDGSREA